MTAYTIQQFQVEFDKLFQNKYPFLKIVFKISDDVKKVHMNLNEWRGVRGENILENLGIHDNVSIEAFRLNMQKRFGLEVFCYRKMYQSWLPVNHTMHLSFLQQNKIGLDLALSNNLY